MGAVAIIALLWGSTSEDRGMKSAYKRNMDIKVKSKRNSGNVDKAFFDKLKKFIAVVVPDKGGREAKYLVILGLLVILRTYMSILLSDINGKLVKSIIKQDFKKFLHKILNLLLFSIPSSAVNSGLDYF